MTMATHTYCLVNSDCTSFMEKYILNLALKMKQNFLCTLLSVWDFALPLFSKEGQGPNQHAVQGIRVEIYFLNRKFQEVCN